MIVRGGQIIFLSLFTLLLLTYQSAVAKEANSIDELVAMFDSSKCAQCHEEIYKQWQNSWHSKAIVSSLGGMRNFIAVGLAREWNTKLTKMQVLKCLDCHAPVVNYATEELAIQIGELVVAAVDKKDSVEGKKAKEEISPVSDLQGSAEYKKELIEVFIQRALKAASNGGRKGV